MEKSAVESIGESEIADTTEGEREESALESDHSVEDVGVNDGCIDGDDDNDDDDDDDDDVHNDGERSEMQDILETLATLSKFKRTRERERDGVFLPPVLSFLRCSMRERATRVKSSKLVGKFTFLAKNIVSKRIAIRVPESEMCLLGQIGRGDICLEDLKILLVEDVRLLEIYKRACKLLLRCKASTR